MTCNGLDAPVADTTRFEEFDLLRRLHSRPELLERLQHTSQPELAVQQQLRQQFPDDLVRAALTLHELRRKAQSKFSRADRMWFDRQGLEQATSEAVARHKARRFEGRALDLCCGIGGDALALAERGVTVAVDRAPSACLQTRWNAEAYGVGEAVRVVCADATRLRLHGGLVHIDPDRRAGTRGRAVRIEECVPGLPFLQMLMWQVRGGAIKLSPASNFTHKFPGAEIELISLHGECKEATVWFGCLAGGSLFRATVLPEASSIAGDPLSATADIVPIAEYLYDPDPAVVRSGLLDLCACRLGLGRTDAAEEYLTAPVLVRSPFVVPLRVRQVLPNNPRAIRAYFRTSDVGQLEIKCRHIPVDADAVRRKLPLPGDQPAVLVFARSAGRAQAVVCERVQ